MKPSSLRQAVFRAIGKLGAHSRDLRTGAVVQRAWREIVGDLMSRYCHPVQVTGRKLKIGVTSAVWLAEMEYLKETLLDNVRRVLGKNVINEVAFCLIDKAPLALSTSQPSPFPPPPLREPTAEQAEQMEKALARVADPDLREQMRRVLCKSMSHRGEVPDHE